METQTQYPQPEDRAILLLARGRDRLETSAMKGKRIELIDLLLARGRDRLETKSPVGFQKQIPISYSLGDAIDWKPSAREYSSVSSCISYSLGDAIDWKLLHSFVDDFSQLSISYSLGDAIDWKQSDRRREIG